MRPASRRAASCLAHSCCRLHRHAETSGDPGADLRVHAAPVLQHAIDDVAPDACLEVGDQVADHVPPISLRQHLLPERARLDEVVVLAVKWYLTQNFSPPALIHMKV